MSVLVVSKKTYENVFTKAVRYSFNWENGISRCDFFSGMREREIAELVKVWCRLNEESYCVRYEEKIENVHESLNLDYNMNCKVIHACQMLKSLQCINYNIEEVTIKQVRELKQEEREAIENLNEIIHQIRSAIIEDMSEYQEALWG